VINIPRQNKIRKYGLVKEVLKLKNDDGLSYKEIEKYIKKKYPEIPKKQLPSHMSIKRFMDSYTEQELEEAVDAGKAVEKIEEEFKKKMREIVGEAEELKNETQKLLKEAIGEKASYSDLVKLIKAQNKNIEQLRKNQISLMEYSDRKFLRPIEHIQEKKELHITQIKMDIQEVLFKLSSKLCPKCRQIVGNEVEDILEDEYDIDKKKKKKKKKYEE
jgi:hypothetical protein